MIKVRKSHERGHANHGWLDTHHTFSFANYRDREFMGFRNLRVINEDSVSPGAGFGKHGHRDMEIITYVLEGTLKHQDSLGNGSLIQPGEVQRMSAGTGILHSEYNASTTDSVHFLQIWILPDTPNLEPSYEQRNFGIAKDPNRLHLVANRNGSDGALTVHQDLNLYAGVLREGNCVSYAFNPQRYAWVQVARGAISLNDISLQAGDGAAINNESNLEIAALEDSEILLFDLA
ncbi:MAG: pirin family protein [Cyanobacteriota bacterium]|nr:pirin family protein [Cyanobacteriota bacterium]